MITPFQAIKKMRELTEKREPFSFSFMSYNRDRQTSSGVIEVSNARLVKKKKKHASGSTVEADLQERYFDLDKGGIRTFWIGTMMTFQGQKISMQ